MSELNCLIGEIVGGFVRTEFILSEILSDLKMKKNHLDFFADSRTGRKLEQIRKEFRESENDKKEDFIRLIDEFDNLRAKRNIIVHSLILRNTFDKDHYIFHNYRMVGSSTLDESTEYRTSDLIDIKNKISAIHNAFYKLHFGPTP